jgi:hypothetical protein
MLQQRIVCAAIKSTTTGKIICGPRHSDCYIQLIDEINIGTYEQGFVDQNCVFLSREEAWKVADAAEQILRKTGLEDYYDSRKAGIGDVGLLFSENLY